MDPARGGGMSALESSITLEDVFVVVGAKRVPLAPELAGYLALEIAEGAAQAVGTSIRATSTSARRGASRWCAPGAKHRPAIRRDRSGGSFRASWR